MVSESFDLSDQAQKRATRKLLIAGIVCVFLAAVSVAIVVAVIIQQNENKRIPNASLDNQYGSTITSKGFIHTDLQTSIQDLITESTTIAEESSTNGMTTDFYTKDVTSSSQTNVVTTGPFIKEKTTSLHQLSTLPMTSNQKEIMSVLFTSSSLPYISTDTPVLSLFSKEKITEVQSHFPTFVSSEIPTCTAEEPISMTENIILSTSFTDLKPKFSSHDMTVDSVTSLLKLESTDLMSKSMTEMLSTHTLISVSDIDNSIQSLDLLNGITTTEVSEFSNSKIPISEMPLSTDKTPLSSEDIILDFKSTSFIHATQLSSAMEYPDFTRDLSTYAPHPTKSETFKMSENISSSVESSIIFISETTENVSLNSVHITDIPMQTTPTNVKDHSLPSLDQSVWIVSAATINTHLETVPTLSNSEFVSIDFDPIKTVDSFQYSVTPSSIHDLYLSSNNMYTTSSQWIDVTVPITTVPAPVSPDCGTNEFRCMSGQCIHLNYRCDRLIQCEDMSDEINCPSCLGFQCGNGLCMWSWSVQCNKHVECADLTDEIGCNHGSSYILCNNSISIPSYKWCNGVDDCFDNSDEINCTCLFNEESCLDGRCIRTEWICDGHTDCIQGTDEDNCSICTPDQYTCNDYSCINSTQICDGVNHCPGADDETLCYHMNISQSLTIQYKGDNYTVCSTHWNPGISDAICQLLGFKNATRTKSYNTSEPEEDFGFIELKQPLSDYSNILQYMNVKSSCTSDMTVSIACMPRECGVQDPDVMIPYVSGGDIATQGKWPWTVSLSYLGRPFCSGTLISEDWVVTAGHCVARPNSYNYTNNPEYIEVFLGSVKRLRDHGISRRADKVIHHPRLKWTGIGPIYYDIALIHLEKPVIFTDFISPICLPQEDFSTLSNCFIAGWGYIGSDQDVTIQDLREAKLHVFTDSECQQNTVPLEQQVNTNITYCTGYKFGYISGCQGDSGSAMMCEDSHGRWTLAGVMSSGAAMCGTFTNTANRFTKVSSMVDWMYYVIYE